MKPPDITSTRCRGAIKAPNPGGDTANEGLWEIVNAVS